MYKIMLLFVVFAISCSNNSNKENQKTKQTKKPKQEAYNIIIKNKAKSNITIGDIVEFSIKSNCDAKLDSIQVTYNSLLLKTYYTSNIHCETNAMNPGKQKLIFTFYWNNNRKQIESSVITLLSDIVPKKYTYNVKQTWTHSTKAYTQGLEFSDGFLYEGTGEYGESMLLKLKLENNEIIQSINLPNDIFGEGITILNDKLYQLTWKSSIGFVYDKNNLQKLYDFNYPTDGWGLTNNGTELIMSDGTETIYFLDAEYFSEIKRIEVYDNIGPVTRLNELELIGDLVYANIYGTDNIVAFDINTGKVIKRINLTGLLNKHDIKTRVDVLNGIAWNINTEQLVVTGKWWPKLFCIELIESKK